jgi:hypothetical protein
MAHVRCEGAAVGLDLVRKSDFSFLPLDTEGMDFTVLAGLQSVVREQSEQPKYTGRVRFEERDRQGLHFTTYNPDGRPLSVICLATQWQGTFYPI